MKQLIAIPFLSILLTACVFESKPLDLNPNNITIPSTTHYTVLPFKVNLTPVDLNSVKFNEPKTGYKLKNTNYYK